jgi:hypothetical protein
MNAQCTTPMSSSIYARKMHRSIVAVLVPGLHCHHHQLSNFPKFFLLLLFFFFLLTLVLLVVLPLGGCKSSISPFLRTLFWGGLEEEERTVRREDAQDVFLQVCATHGRD